MDEELIKSVSDVLLEWNPLGEYADLVKDLEGYKYEASDIIWELKIRKISTKRVVSDVLTQAFNITLDEAQLMKYSAEIEQRIKSST